jgi:hypothetical protein
VPLSRLPTNCVGVADSPRFMLTLRAHVNSFSHVLLLGAEDAVASRGRAAKSKWSPRTWGAHSRRPPQTIRPTGLPVKRLICAKGLLLR